MASKREPWGHAVRIRDEAVNLVNSLDRKKGKSFSAKLVSLLTELKQRRDKNA